MLPAASTCRACYLTNGQPRPKVNDCYVWSMARAGRKLYFGTVANGSALAAAGSSLNSGAAAPPNESFIANQEFTLSTYGQAIGIQPPIFGDWRPPNLFRYDVDTRVLEKLSDSLPPAAVDHLRQIEGFRAGGSAPPSRLNPHGLVVLAGPRLDDSVGGVGFFFFDGATGEFLGSIIRPEFNNIRRFVACNGDLYAGVQRTGPENIGAVIRIVNRPREARFPFNIEIVGELDQAGADIAWHDGRLFVTTWPGFLDGGTVDMSNPLVFLQRATGLWMSPPVPPTGLTSAHGRNWTKVWHANLYDPDMVMAATYGGGALCSFDGWLYFGTMHNRSERSAYAKVYGLPEATPPAGSTPGTPAYDDWLANRSPTVVNARATRKSSLFRMRGFRKPRALAGIPITPGGECQVLYGYQTMPVWNKPAGVWLTQTNVMKQTPLMGPAGLGSSVGYVWCMANYRNSLYLGTLGATMTLRGVSPVNEADLRKILANPQAKIGGSLLMLPSSRAGAFIPVSESGLGNPCNVGIRTMDAGDDALYLGTASVNNLLGNFHDDLPDGGWELLKLTRRPATAFDVDGDYVADPAWSLPDGDALALGSVGPTTNAYAGVAASRTAWADYDGDGLVDPGWFTPRTGRWRARLSTHSNLLVELAVTSGIKSGAIPVPADFDGDGEADLAWCDPAGGAITWQSLAAGAGARTTVKRGGLAGAVPAVADYDGDGRADPAWYVQASGSWYIRYSASGYDAMERRGAIRGTPVPADLDGDGRADLAVCDAVTGAIRVLRYSDGSPAFTTPEAPGADWLPMCGDYDGDGRADFAWYLPSAFLLRIRYAAGGTGEWLVPEVGQAAARPVATPAARDFQLQADRPR